LSLGLGRKPSRGLDAFPFPIASRMFYIKSYHWHPIARTKPV
jgi:hypothetical protein